MLDYYTTMAMLQYSKAILNCNEAIKLKPLSVRGYLYRGALKYHIRAYELAMRDLTQATKIDNKCSLAYFNRAVCYQDSGQYEKALTDYGIVLLLGDQLMLKVFVSGWFIVIYLVKLFINYYHYFVTTNFPFNHILLFDLAKGLC